MWTVFATLLSMNYEVGIDEAGRGPLAGPVAVGVVLVPAIFNWEKIPEVNDSKKLTEQKREELFFQVQDLQEKGELTYAVSLVSAGVIDKRGIVFSVNTGMRRALQRVICNSTVNRMVQEVGFNRLKVKLDGGLKAPEEFTHQETIVKGDSKEKIIGLASIMAKVTRDRYMRRISTKPQYAAYSFDTHKGYGTKAHREAIVRYGLSDLHRKTFCRNLLSS